MADPTPYAVSYSFSGFQATSPNSPLPAPRVDDEYANIATSIGTLVGAVTDVRREDGALKNSIVTVDSLHPSVGVRLGVAYANAYEVAVAEGYEGTVTEWLATLAANVTVGSVTTSDPGSDAEVVATGTPPNMVLSFTIPRGNPGPSGDGSGDMVASVYDPTGVEGDAFSMSNMVEGSNAKVLTGSERTAISTIASKLGTGDVASAANIRANIAAKVVDTTGAWGATEMVTLADAPTIAVDMSTFVNAQVTLGANRTLGAPSNAKPGQSGCIKVTASGATRTIGKHSAYKSSASFPVSIASGESAYLFYFVVSASEVLLNVVDGVV
ncbi:hypothetical protein [Thauera sp.]|uniref:hypothetical protein n=1 Tax=Thauera sp. TaxID=1905334 RepID=UPI002BF650FB|nr:hypothetical protein [Thauera sp.]HRP25407.1 hypothetical protein [Thauera sp.]